VFRLLHGETAEPAQGARAQARRVLPRVPRDAQEQTKAHGAFDGLVWALGASALKGHAKSVDAVEELEQNAHFPRGLAVSRGVHEDRVTKRPQRNLDQTRIRGGLAQEIGQARARDRAVLVGVLRSELAL
jgi:hypothetical protein